MDVGSFDLVAAWQPTSRIRVRLAIWFSYVLAAALAVSALLLVARRFAGGLEQPLSPAALTLAAALASLLAAGSRVALSGGPFAHFRAPLVVRWLPAVSLVIFVAALSVRGTSAFALATAWSVVVAEEFLIWLRFRIVGRTAVAPAAPRPLQEAFGQLIAEPREPDLPLAVSRIAAPPLLLPPALAPQSLQHSPEVVQQQTRMYLANGLDRLTGWLQMALATGERNATAHVAFCPPFLETPKISLRQTAGPAGRIRAVQILPHGVRLELKLDLSPRHPQRVSIEFVAESRWG